MKLPDSDMQKLWNFRLLEFQKNVYLFPNYATFVYNSSHLFVAKTVLKKNLQREKIEIIFLEYEKFVNFRNTSIDSNFKRTASK